MFPQVKLSGFVVQLLRNKKQKKQKQKKQKKQKKDQVRWKNRKLKGSFSEMR